MAPRMVENMFPVDSCFMLVILFVSLFPYLLSCEFICFCRWNISCTERTPVNVIIRMSKRRDCSGKLFRRQMDYGRGYILVFENAAFCV